MNSTLFVHCSPHGAKAHGTKLASRIVRHQQSTDPARTVVERDLANSPLPVIDFAYAKALTGGSPAEQSDFACSERLIGELEATDQLVISMPMHNFTVPAAFKLWVDYVVRINRSFVATDEGKVGLLADRPTMVIVSAGGFIRQQHSQPDFLTPYTELVMATVGICDVAFIYLEGLTQGSNAIAATLSSAERDLIARDVLPISDAF